MKKKLTVKTLALILTTCVLALTACSSKPTEIEKIDSGDITAENLTSVCEILKAKNLSNIDTFETWVKAYLNGDAENSDSSGFADADCRMTVMLLAGDSITADSVEESYDGTYLMFDVEAIENQDAYSVLKDKKQLFTTLFGEMPITDGNFQNAFPDNIKNHGIKFSGKDFSVVSILFKAYEEENAFVGHTGLLLDCKNIDAVDTDYLFVEKIAFNDVYKVTKIKDENHLIEELSKRPDYMVEEGDPSPLVYRDDKLIGKLKP